MTWSEIKKAVEEIGISDADEITVIQCESRSGDKTFHTVRLGKQVKLAENVSSADREDFEGCAV